MKIRSAEDLRSLISAELDAWIQRIGHPDAW
jgi:hypothetical protein